MIEQDDFDLGVRLAAGGERGNTPAPGGVFEAFEQTRAPKPEDRAGCDQPHNAALDQSPEHPASGIGRIRSVRICAARARASPRESVADWGYTPAMAFWKRSRRAGCAAAGGVASVSFLSSAMRARGAGWVFAKPPPPGWS